MILNLFSGNSEQSMFYQNTLLFVYKKDGNMRFKIMFGTTFIILLYLLFYPRTTYLNKYDKSITVDYSNFISHIVFDIFVIINQLYVFN